MSFNLYEDQKQTAVNWSANLSLISTFVAFWYRFWIHPWLLTKDVQASSFDRSASLVWHSTQWMNLKWRSSKTYLQFSTTVNLSLYSYSCNAFVHLLHYLFSLDLSNHFIKESQLCIFFVSCIWIMHHCYSASSHKNQVNILLHFCGCTSH